MEKNVEISDEEMEETGFNLLDYLVILAKHKKLILSITLPVAIITLLLTIPKNTFYQAEISLIPPQQQEISIASQIMGQLGIMANPINTIRNKQELLVEIIKSRTVTERIIKKFKLQGSYGAKDMGEARKIFLENITIQPDFMNRISLGMRAGQSPLTRIFVRDPSSKKAADIANAIVDEIKLFINNIAISRASERRLFFEQQSKQAMEALSKSEEDMKKFLEKNGILAQGNKMKIAANKFAPALEMEQKRLFRQLEFREALYGIMVKQYEAAKIDESEDTIMIQIVDNAIPPTIETTVRKFGRKKALSVTVFTLLSVCFFVFAREYYERTLKTKGNSEKINTLKKHLSFGKKV